MYGRDRGRKSTCSCPTAHASLGRLGRRLNFPTGLLSNCPCLLGGSASPLASPDRSLSDLTVLLPLECGYRSWGQVCPPGHSLDLTVTLISLFPCSVPQHVRRSHISSTLQLLSVIISYYPIVNSELLILLRGQGG